MYYYIAFAGVAQTIYFALLSIFISFFRSYLLASKHILSE